MEIGIAPQARKTDWKHRRHLRPKGFRLKAVLQTLRVNNVSLFAKVASALGDRRTACLQSYYNKQSSNSQQTIAESSIKKRL